MQGVVAGVEQAMPGGGCVVGQGALQCQVLPIGPPGKHVQSVVPNRQWTPTFEHMELFVGSVVGHVPQLHIPKTQVQSEEP
jgi:hypothetical protein